MQVYITPGGILYNQEDLRSLCLCPEELTLKPVPVLGEVAADFVNVSLPLYGNVPLKGQVPDLCGVVPYVQFPGKVRYILFIPVGGQVLVDLFPAVCDDFKIL